jgi:hypothetical protein
MPAGALVTVPEPVALTWRAKRGMNVAVTVCAAVIDTVQVVPVVAWQAPPQPENMLPKDGNSLCAGAAVSTTLVPLGNAAAHADGQSTPAGALATLPGPAMLTWSAKTGVKVAPTLCAAVMDTVQVGPVLD